MQDYYAERLRPLYRYETQFQPLVYSHYDYDDRPPSSMQRQLSRVCRPRQYDSDSESDEDNGIEKATRAHIEATSEYEKAKEKSDEAQKKLEECEAKVQAAAKRLNKAKKELRRLCACC